MTPLVSPQDVRSAWLTRREIALFDVREEHAYADAHPLFAASLPLSRIELEILNRVPRKGTQIVLYDGGEGLAVRAAQLLTELGYSNVTTLAGGLDGWRDAGFELFQDVNSASKAFGELVEHRRHTPSIAAVDLKAKLTESGNLVVLDVRPFDEYQRMHVPTAINVPGVDLISGARALAPDPQTTIVVSCAGRTRGIIGTQSLLNAGLPNPVMALRNGTIGWSLANQDLECQEMRMIPLESAASNSSLRTMARDLSYRAGVRHISYNQLREFAADPARTLYRFDVRRRDEYIAGHPSGFRHAPGGQLLQETDVFAPVRSARVVVWDSEQFRADMTASWLAQMGWEVYVLDAPVAADFVTGDWRPALPTAPALQELSASDLRDMLGPGCAVLDFALSSDFGKGHVPGAWFVKRSELNLDTLDGIGTLVLTSDDGLLARYVAPDIRGRTGKEPFVLSGGTAAWRGGNYPIETGFPRALSSLEDVYKKPYVGTDIPRDTMQAYLDWEFGLVAQLERDGSHGFYVI